MHGLPPLVPIIIKVAIAIIAWFVVDRFSPDPLLTKICKIIIFVVVLVVIVLPLLGVG